MKKNAPALMVNLRAIFGICLVSMFIVTITPMLCVAAEKIILVGSQDTKTSFHGKWLSLIYTEVFRRLGYELQYDGYPSLRASRMSDAGIVDGEINRVTSYQNTHPNMIRVNESHFPTTLAAYAVKPGIALDGWDSLKKKGYVVGYRRGTKIVELGLKSVVKPGQLFSLTTADQGLKMLIIGRIDIYVDVQDTVTEILGWLNTSKFDSTSVYTAGIMSKSNLHLYMHKKNAALVPKIDRVLKAMKKEGLITHFKQRAFQPQ